MKRKHGEAKVHTVQFNRRWVGEPTVNCDVGRCALLAQRIVMEIGGGQ